MSVESAVREGAEADANPEALRDTVAHDETELVGVEASEKVRVGVATGDEVSLVVTELEADTEVDSVAKSEKENVGVDASDVVRVIEPTADDVAQLDADALIHDVTDTDALGQDELDALDEIVSDAASVVVRVGDGPPDGDGASVPVRVSDAPPDGVDASVPVRVDDAPPDVVIVSDGDDERHVLTDGVVVGDGEDVRQVLTDGVVE